MKVVVGSKILGSELVKESNRVDMQFIAFDSRTQHAI